MIIKTKLKKKLYYKEDNVKKVKIIIDKEIKIFEHLFHNKIEIEKISFMKFNRKDINNMRYMFNYCSTLKELNLNNFKPIM